MRYLKTTLALLLCATPALAQYGGSYPPTGNIQIYDTNFTLIDNTTPTKKLQFQLSGLAAGTSTFTFPSGGGAALVDGVQTINIGVTDTHDRFILTAPVKGAGQFDGTLSFSDLTGATSWYLPSDSGTLLLSPTVPGVSNSFWGTTGGIVFEGDATGAAANYETTLSVADPTADRAISLPDYGGTLMLSTLTTNAPDVANSVSGASNALVFEGATGGVDAFETSLTVTDPTADRTVTIPNFSGTLLISSTANEPDTGNAFWVNTGELKFEGSTANAFETTVNVIDPTAARSATFIDASGYVLLSIDEPGQADAIWTDSGTGFLTFEGGTGNDHEAIIDPGDPTADRTLTLPDKSGTLDIYPPADEGYNNTDLTLFSLINGGYGLGNTTHSTSTVTITVNDPTDDQNPGMRVQVCGHLTAADQTQNEVTCSATLVFADEGTSATAASFVEIVAIKTNTLVDAAADVTIGATWTSGAEELFAATAPVAHPESEYNAGGATAITASRFATLFCWDEAGCDVEPSTTAHIVGEELTFVIGEGSENIKFTEGTYLKLSAATHTLDDFDTLKLLVYNYGGLKFVQLSVSAN